MSTDPTFDASRDAVAKLHRERPDLIGTNCRCPTCQPSSGERQPSEPTPTERTP